MNLHRGLIRTFVWYCYLIPVFQELKRKGKNSRPVESGRYPRSSGQAFHPYACPKGVPSGQGLNHDGPVSIPILNAISRRLREQSLCDTPSAEKLRARSGKTMMGSAAARALANFCRRDGHERNRAKVLQPVVLPDLQRKGPVRQRSLPADKRFWLLLSPQK